MHKWKSLSKRSFSFSLNQTWKSLLSWKKESWSKWWIRSEAQRTQGTQAKCCGALWRWCDGTGPVRREEEECGLRWLLGQWTCSSPIKHEGLITAFWPHCTGFVLGTSPLTSRWHETGCRLTICREFVEINYICLYYHQYNAWRKTIALNVTLQCNVFDEGQHPSDCGMSALSQSVHLSFFKSLALICLSVCLLYNHLWLYVPLCSVWLIFKPLRTRQEA